METLFLLIPLSFLLLAGIIAALYWSISNGQYEDLVGPAERVAHEPDFVKRDEEAAAEDASRP